MIAWLGSGGGDRSWGHRRKEHASLLLPAWKLLISAAQSPVPSMGPTEPALPMEMLGSKHRLERRRATSRSMWEQSCELLCMWLRGSCLCNLQRLEWGHSPIPAGTGNLTPRPPLVQRMNAHREVALSPGPLQTGEYESE